MRIASMIAQRVAAFVASLAAGGLLAVGAAAPASAETMNGVCESGELCLYYHTDFNGPVADMYDDNPNYYGWHFAASEYWLNDNARSAKDRAYWFYVCVSEHANYGGKMFWRGSDNQSISTFGVWNDKASSHRWLGSCAYN